MGLPPNIDPEDLNSYGIFGLVDAVEKFRARSRASNLRRTRSHAFAVGV